MFSSDFFTTTPQQALILSGASAVARGAFEAGVGLAVTYPGSPVVETFDELSRRDSPLARASQVVINEHVAFHRALGFSLAGGRSLVIMKHVGLNVASDPAHYSGYTGIRGGMLVLVGFDPGATCSTGEFDCRLYSLHTHLPILEPGTVQEAMDWTREGFLFSENLGVPVMIFLPSKLCYGMGTVATGVVQSAGRGLGFPHSQDLTNVGPRAVERHRLLMEKIERLGNENRDATVQGVPGDWRHVVQGKDLVVTSGIHRDIVREVLENLGVSKQVSVYAPAVTYPMSKPGFLSAVEESGARRILFVEELEGLLEIQGTGHLARSRLSLEIRGKDIFPPWGGHNFQSILEKLGGLLGQPPPPPRLGNGEISEGLKAVPREGTFCPGCPHRAFFDTLIEVLTEDDIIGGDIGCSSLPPHFSDWLTCMNSGTSIASGISLALKGPGSQQRTNTRVVSLIGDSTLFHSGLQTILDCAQRDSDQVCFVLDNSWTAMTGHQATPGTPRDSQGQRIPGAVDLMALLKACGIKRVVRADPLRVNQLKQTMLRLLSERGFSCVLVARECRLQEKRRGETGEWEDRFGVIPERCRKCNRCYSVLTCPAIGKNPDGEAIIDPDICTGCSVCHQICPNDAIVRVRVHRSRSGLPTPVSEYPPEEPGEP